MGIRGNAALGMRQFLDRNVEPSTSGRLRLRVTDRHIVRSRNRRNPTQVTVAEVDAPSVIGMRVLAIAA